MKYYYPAYRCGLEYVRRSRNAQGIQTIIYRVWCERGDESCQWSETVPGMRKATFYMDLHNQAHSGYFASVRLPASEDRQPLLDEYPARRRGRKPKKPKDEPPPF